MTDGNSAILEPLVQCLNISGDGTTYQRYQYLTDNIEPEANEKDHLNADGSPLGGFSGEGIEKGTISVQKTKASHKWPRPGHVIQFDCGEPAGIFASTSRYYRVGKSGNARTLNEVTKGSISVTRLYGLVLPALLTEEYGQRKYVSQSAGAWSAFTTNLSNDAVNKRTGSTIAFYLEAMPGHTVPSWLSCNSSTGVLSGTATAASGVEVKIVATETLSNQETRTGFGILNITVT